MAFEATDEVRSWQRSSEAHEQPRKAVTEATLHRFRARGPGLRGALQEPSETRQVLLVLIEQDAKEPLGWDDADEAPFRVHHRQRGLLVSHGPPRGNFLIDTGRDNRNLAIRQVADQRVIRCCE